jgi:MerR family mercuric resistance operon transcriptional regulator
MPERTLRTGEVADAAGVNVETLRYYERRGLLKEPKRRGSGYREYPLETVHIIRFIKRAQELGFTLDEIEELLRLRNDRSRTCGEVRTAAITKIEDIDRKIRSLHAIRHALSALVTACTDEPSTRECPILETLDGQARAKE